MFYKISVAFLFSLLVVFFFTHAQNPYAPHALQEVKISDEKVGFRFKKMMTSYLEDRGFSGGVIVIYKKGKLILKEGYGRCVDPDIELPIASLSKVFTEMAIRRLISENVFSEDTSIYDYLGLNLHVVDVRVKTITIGQLLEHSGGWNRGLSMDPTFAISDCFSGEDPRSLEQQTLIKYVLENVYLDHYPGQAQAYCNFGYILLGAAIEKATGMSYLNYINSTFAYPLGVRLSQAKTPDQFSREIPYEGSFSMEASTSSFGIAAKTDSVAKITSFFNKDGSLKKSPDRDRILWSKDGSLPGTVTALVRQRINDVVIAIIIPDRDESNWMDDNQQLKRMLDNTANSVGL